MKRRTVGKGVISITDGYWEWFRRTDPPPYEITGKYLFFSADRDLLVKIAIEELESGAFYHAKIPVAGKNISQEYVLCLYYKDDSKKHELARKYRNQESLRYRYWKSNKATLKGEYSEQFLQSLTPEERELFIERESRYRRIIICNRS